MPPGQRPTSLRPSPAPSNPAPPRRGSIAQRVQVIAAQRHRAAQVIITQRVQVIR